MRNRVLAAIAALLVSAPAFAYDDPAVAVCEYSWARGANLSANGYVRTSANIVGDTVTLTYDHSVLNTAPKTFVQTCRYEADIAGDLLLASERSPELQACNDLADQQKPTTEKYGPSSREVRELAGQIAQCEPILRAEADKQNEILMKVSFPLLSMGLYPIKPRDTAVVAPIDRAKFQKECDGKRAALAEVTARQETGDSLELEVKRCSDAGF